MLIFSCVTVLSLFDLGLQWNLTFQQLISFGDSCTLPGTFVKSLPETYDKWHLNKGQVTSLHHRNKQTLETFLSLSTKLPAIHHLNYSSYLDHNSAIALGLGR